MQRFKLRFPPFLLLQLVQLVLKSAGVSICSLRLLPGSGSQNARCMCWDSGPGQFNTVLYPLTSTELSICAADGGTGDPSDVGVLPGWDLPAGATTLRFSGPGAFLLDGTGPSSALASSSPLPPPSPPSPPSYGGSGGGSSAPYVVVGANAVPAGVVAADLDLLSGGGDGSANNAGEPLLRFTGLSNVTLRNLAFQNITVSAATPLIRIEGCNSVSLSNIVFTSVTVVVPSTADAAAIAAAADDGSGGAIQVLLGALVSVAAGSGEAGADVAVTGGVDLSGILLRRVRVVVATDPQSPGGVADVPTTTALVAVTGCAGGTSPTNSSDGGGGGSGSSGGSGSGGCAIRGVSLQEVTVLAPGAHVLHVANSSGVAVSDVSTAATPAAGSSTSSSRSTSSSTSSGSSSTSSSSTSSGSSQAATLPPLLVQGEGAAVLTLEDCAPGCRLERVSLGAAVAVAGPTAAVAVAGTAAAITVQLGGGALALDAIRCAGLVMSQLQLADTAISQGPAASAALAASVFATAGSASVSASAGASTAAYVAALRLSACPQASLSDVSLVRLTASGTAFGLVLAASSTGVTAQRLAVRAFTGSANATSSAVYVREGSDAVLSGTTCDGSQAEEGPCLRLVESAVAVEGGRFVGNTAAALGGAVRVVEGTRRRPTTLVVRGGAVFQNNTALEAGGAICAYAEAGVGPALNISDAAFSGNTARRGGALALVPVQGGLPTARLVNCTFTANTAQVLLGPAGAAAVATVGQQAVPVAFGGDVYAVDGAALELVGSTFSGGSAALGVGGSGGCVYLQRAGAALSDCRFIGCSAPNRGGALLHEPVDGASCPASDPAACGLTLRRCRFNGCAAGEGGALAIVLNANRRSQLTMDGCDFTSNRAAITGGAVAVLGNCMPYSNPAGCGLQADAALQVHSQVSDCAFTANTAPMAGALYQAYNNAQGINITRCVFESNNASEAGALYVRAVPVVEIRHTLFANQTSTLIGAAELLSLHDHATLHNTTFRNNSCNRNNANTGSSLYVAEYDGVTTNGQPDGPLFQLTLTNSTFEDNYSSSEAGGATITRCEALLEDLAFRNNAAGGRAGALFLEADVGGLTQAAIMEGVPRRVTNGTLRRLAFSGNRASRLAGALLVSGWYLDMQDVVFSGNSVNTYAAGGLDNAGGAVFATQCPAGSTLQLRNMVFECNSAFQGGALAAELCSIYLTNATFNANSATGDAGAVLVSGFTVNQQPTAADTAAGNAANSSSGAVFTLEVRNTSFTDNTAANGVGGALKAYWAMLRVADSTFTRNTASGQGGAVYMQFVPPMPSALSGQVLDTGMRAWIERSTFTANAVNNSGGAIALAASAVQMYDCHLYGNRAGGGAAGGAGLFADSWSAAGGGVFALGCIAPMQIWRTGMDGNQAGGRGGALALLTCGARVYDSALSGNTARLSGGGVAAGHQASTLQPEGPLLQLQNCSLSGNTALDEDGGGVHCARVPLLLAGSHLRNNTANQRGGGVYGTSARSFVAAGCVLDWNRAGVAGGAAYLESGDVVQVGGCSVADNAAVEAGGGLALVNMQCSYLRSLTLARNRAARGGGVQVTMPALSVAPAPAGGALGSGTAALPLSQPWSTAQAGMTAGCPAAFSALEQQLADASSGGGGPQRRLAEAVGSIGWLTTMSAAAQRVAKQQVADIYVVATGVMAINNSALDGSGGALLLEALRGSLLLDGLNATGNIATAAGSTASSAAGGGGAVALTDTRQPCGAALFVTSSQLSANVAAGGGSGGALAADGSRTHQQLLLVNSTLGSNQADQGGAVAVVRNASLALSGCRLQDNNAAGGGGGGGGSVFAAGCKLLVLSDTNITGSTASNGANGGGLAADSCTVVLMDRVRMYGNSATGSGGGAYVTASGTAPGGGSTSGSGRAAVAVLAVSASNISYNHAGSSSYSGAAAAGDVGLPTGSGGALYMGGAVAALVERSHFEGNTAAAMAGAVGLGLRCAQGADVGAWSVEALQAAAAAAAIELGPLLTPATAGAGSPATGALPPASLPLSSSLMELVSPRNQTLQALARAAARSSAQSGCWPAVVASASLWNNAAGGSGGALFSSSAYTLALLCGSSHTLNTADTGGAGATSPTAGTSGGGSSSGDASNGAATAAAADTALARLVDATTTATPELADSSSSSGISFSDMGTASASSSGSSSGSSSIVLPPAAASTAAAAAAATANSDELFMGSLPTTEEERALCFQPPQIEGGGPAAPPNRVRSGYGAELATAPKQLVLSSIREYDQTQLLAVRNDSANRINVTYLDSVLYGGTGDVVQVYGRRRLQQAGGAAAAATAPDAPTQVLGQAVVGGGPPLQPDGGSSTGSGMATAGGGSDTGVPLLLWLSRVTMLSAAAAACSNNGSSGGGEADGGGSGGGSSSAQQQRVYLRECWSAQACRLVMPNNLGVAINVSVYDALNQLTADPTASRPVIRASMEMLPAAPSTSNSTTNASVASSVADANSTGAPAGPAVSASPARPDLLGNPTAQVVEGVASMAGLRVRAKKGDYVLRLELDTAASSAAAGGAQSQSQQQQAVPPLLVTVTVPPCSLGEVVQDQGFLCSRCSANTFSLDVDPYAGDPRGAAFAAANGNVGGGSCQACPDHAVCPGGAVVVPEPGYWHSAANSTRMHRCPNPSACKSGDDDVNLALQRCQDRWYAYFGTASRFWSLVSAPDGGRGVVGAYLDVFRSLSAGDARAVPASPLLPQLGGMTAGSSSGLTTAAARANFDGFLLDCVLWGSPPGTAPDLTYMAQQCAPGYAGTLCATCTAYGGQQYALDSDFNCSTCFNGWQTVLIGVAVFLLNTAWLGFSVLMTFLADYTHDEDRMPPADVLKVLIVHFQFFLIVTRINMDWPASVLALQSLLGSITGTVKQVYSPSCLYDGADSATQAVAQVLAGLLLPVLSVLVVMLLWTLRYFFWNQRWFWQLYSGGSAGARGGIDADADDADLDVDEGDMEHDMGKSMGSPPQFKTAGSGDDVGGNGAGVASCGGGAEPATPNSIAAAAAGSQGGAAGRRRHVSNVFSALATRLASITSAGSADRGGGSGGGGSGAGTPRSRNRSALGAAAASDAHADCAAPEVVAASPPQKPTQRLDNVLRIRLPSREAAAAAAAGAAARRGPVAEGALRDDGAVAAHTAAAAAAAVPPASPGGDGISGAGAAAGIPVVVAAGAAAGAMLAPGSPPAGPHASDGLPTSSLASRQQLHQGSIGSASPAGPGWQRGGAGITSGAALAADSNGTPLALASPAVAAAAAAAIVTCSGPGGMETQLNPLFSQGPGPSLSEGNSRGGLGGSSSGAIGRSLGGSSRVFGGSSGSIKADGLPEQRHHVQGSPVAPAAAPFATAAAAPAAAVAAPAAGAPSHKLHQQLLVQQHSRRRAADAATAVAAVAASAVSADEQQPPGQAAPAAAAAAATPIASPSLEAPTVVLSSPLLPPPPPPQPFDAIQPQTSIALSAAYGVPPGVDSGYGASAPHGSVYGSGYGAAYSGYGNALSGYGGGVPYSGYGAAGPHSGYGAAYSGYSGVAAYSGYGDGAVTSSPYAAALGAAAGAGSGRIQPQSTVSISTNLLPKTGSRGHAAGSVGGGGGSEAGGLQRNGTMASIARSDHHPPPPVDVDSQAGRRKIWIFKQRQALSFVDAHMSLRSQLFLVLMVTSFVMMPTWATEALSIFACMTLDDGQGDYPANQQAVWRYGFWVRDMNQTCYTNKHLTFWVPLGVCAVVVLCLAPPITSAALMFARRRKLGEQRTVQVYGFLYHSYKPRWYFWESLSQAQTLLLVVVEVFGRTLPVYQQALLLTAILLCILMLNTYMSPLRAERLTRLQLLSLGTICLTATLGMFTSNPDVTVSKASDAVLGAVILIINCLIIAAFLALFVVASLPTMRRKASKWMTRLGVEPSRLVLHLPQVTHINQALSRAWTRITPTWRRPTPATVSDSGRAVGPDPGPGPDPAVSVVVSGAPDIDAMATADVSVSPPIQPAVSGDIGDSRMLPPAATGAQSGTDAAAAVPDALGGGMAAAGATCGGNVPDGGQAERSGSTAGQNADGVGKTGVGVVAVEAQALLPTATEAAAATSAGGI